MGFGKPLMMNVYNVLLEKKRADDGQGGPWWWERVVVGKMSYFAFGHAKPEEELIVLR